MGKFLSTLDIIVYKVLKAISLFCMGALLIILFFNVFFRIVPILSVIPNFSMGWFDEIVEILFAWMIFSTASLLTVRGEHFKVELLETKLKGKKSGILLLIFISLFSIAFLTIFMIYSWQLTSRAVQTTPVLHIQKKWMYLCMPINALIMLWYSVKELINHCLRLFKGEAKAVKT